MLRRIYGGKKLEDVYRKRTNSELYELYKNPNIVVVVTSRRVQWLKHTKRMSEEQTVKWIA